jgi:hypothetical protein
MLMDTTKETPARLSPDEGNNTSTPTPQPIVHGDDRQAPRTPFDVADAIIEIRWSAEQLLDSHDITGKSVEHLLQVLNYMWGVTAPSDPSFLRFWKVQVMKGWQLILEIDGRFVCLGELSVLASQARFRRALLKATAYQVPVLIQPYRRATWHAIARCILKFSQVRTEGSHV